MIADPILVSACLESVCIPALGYIHDDVIAFHELGLSVLVKCSFPEIGDITVFKGGLNGIIQ